MTYSIKNALSAICDVRIGYTARQGLKTTPGGIRAIQLRDLHEEDDLDPASAPLYPLDPSLKQRYSAGAGDLLFRSRGNRNTAVMIAPDSTEAVVAVLPLIVLRPNRDVVDSRYLAWFINQPRTQRYFHRYARGTRLRMIPKACLDNLEVELPDFGTQRLIVEIHALARREHTLAHQLADKKLELTSFALLRQAKSPAPRHDDWVPRL
jgi:hypothetical protein